MAEEQREDRSPDEDIGFLKRAAAVLAEHFDTVQIFCTRELGADGTASVKWGVGNWFARKGQVDEWVLTEEAAAKAKLYKEADDEEA